MSENFAKLRQKSEVKKYRPGEELYIMLNELAFEWYEWEVEAVRDAYERNEPVKCIAREVQRLPVEVWLLLLDLRLQGRINCNFYVG